MALPSPGSQISFSQVNTELSLSAGANLALSYGGTELASITAGQQVGLSNDLGGTSAGDTITLSYSSFPGTSYSGGYYRTANHAGHTSPQIITINFIYSCTCSNSGGIYYSKNSTSSWTTVRTWFGTSVSGGYSITNVAYNDVIRVRWYEAVGGTLQGNVSQFNGGTVTSGSGTVTGNSTWVVT